MAKEVKFVVVAPQKDKNGESKPDKIIDGDYRILEPPKREENE